MLPRERVLTTLNHQEPDRVPTALWGGSYGLVDEIYLQMVGTLGLEGPVKPFRSGHTVSYMDDRLLAALGTDLRYVWPARMPSTPTPSTGRPGTFSDSFGQEWIRARPYYYPDRGVFASATEIDDIQQLVRWPDTDAPGWMEGVRERSHFLRHETPYFVVLRMVSSHGPFQTACNLRGTENFLMDMIAWPEFAAALLKRVTDVLAGLLAQAMHAGGANFDMVELPGDDYAGSNRLILSPALFRRFIKPNLERMVGVIRAANPVVKIMAHSDGEISGLLDDFVDLGIEVIHPLEPVSGMDLTAIKARYGERLTFLGGIDITHALRGSQTLAIEEVRRRIGQLAPGGGYILAPANHIQADVPPENVVAVYNAARQFGRYPIRL